jgi:hypothetical protein
MAQYKRKGTSILDGITKFILLADIVDNIKIKRAVHVIRMEEERIARNVLNGKFHNTRQVGKPRTRWVDVVQKDQLQILEIREWRR